MTGQRVVFSAIACALFVITGCTQLPSFRKLAKTSDQDSEHIISVARLAERRGETDAARRVYENLIGEGLATQVAHHRLGVIAAKENDLSGALEHFEASRVAGNDSVDLQVDIAYASFLSGNRDAAEALLNRALIEEPSNKRALNNMAILRASQGRFDDCLALSSRVVGTAKAHSNVGYLQTKFGDIDAASNSFHRALTKDPELKIAANALLQLEQPNLIMAPPSLDNQLAARREAEKSSPQTPSMLPTQDTMPPVLISVPPSLANTEPVPVLISVPPSLANTEPALTSVAPALATTEPALTSVAPTLATSEPAITSMPSALAARNQSTTPSPIQPAVELAAAIAPPQDATPAPIIRRKSPVRLASSQEQPAAGEKTAAELTSSTFFYDSPTTVQTGALKSSGSR